MPLFSNAVASRTFHARRANRRAGLARDRDGAGAGVGHGENLLDADGGGGSYASESESGDVSPVERPREGGGVLRNQEFVKSIVKF